PACAGRVQRDFRNRYKQIQKRIHVLSSSENRRTTKTGHGCYFLRSSSSRLASSAVLVLPYLLRMSSHHSQASAFLPSSRNSLAFLSLLAAAVSGSMMAGVGAGFGLSCALCELAMGLGALAPLAAFSAASWSLVLPQTSSISR